MASKAIVNNFLPPYTIGSLPLWAADHTQAVNDAISNVAARANVGLPTDGSEKMTGPLQLQTVAYASLPSPGTAGRMIYVSNANVNTWGATIDGAGAGTNKVLAWDNGTHWTVVGK